MALNRLRDFGLENRRTGNRSVSSNLTHAVNVAVPGKIKATLTGGLLSEMHLQYLPLLPYARGYVTRKIEPANTHMVREPT
jgi:hypothetical protein